MHSNALPPGNSVHTWLCVANNYASAELVLIGFRRITPVLLRHYKQHKASTIPEFSGEKYPKTYLGQIFRRQEIRLFLAGRIKSRAPSVGFVLYNGDIQCQLHCSEVSVWSSRHRFPALSQVVSELPGAHQTSWFLTSTFEGSGTN